MLGVLLYHSQTYIPETGSSGPPDSTAHNAGLQAFLGEAWEFEFRSQCFQIKPLTHRNVNLMTLFQRIQCCEFWETYHLINCGRQTDRQSDGDTSQPRLSWNSQTALLPQPLWITACASRPCLLTASLPCLVQIQVFPLVVTLLSPPLLFTQAVSE